MARCCSAHVHKHAVSYQILFRGGSLHFVRRHGRQHWVGRRQSLYYVFSFPRLICPACRVSTVVRRDQRAPSCKPAASPPSAPHFSHACGRTRPRQGLPWWASLRSRKNGHLPTRNLAQQAPPAFSRQTTPCLCTPRQTTSLDNTAHHTTTYKTPHPLRPLHRTPVALAVCRELRIQAGEHHWHRLSPASPSIRGRPRQLHSLLSLPLQFDKNLVLPSPPPLSCLTCPPATVTYAAAAQHPGCQPVPAGHPQL